MLAALMSGLRWSLTQILLRHGGSPAASLQLSRQGQGGNGRVSTSTSRSAAVGNTDASGHGHQHPIASVMLLSPVMALCLFIVAICLESSMASSVFFTSIWSTIQTLSYMSLGGFIAFLMVVSEFVVIRRIGVVTLSVCGIFKVSYIVL
jgi:hypothetical protein